MKPSLKFSLRSERASTIGDCYQMKMISKKSSAVVYHYPCPDGAFAALAAHLYFSFNSHPVLFYPNTVYNPLRTEQLPLHQLSDVYLLDFVGPSGFVQDLSSRVSRVFVLDHHKTALENLSEESSIGENVTWVIDMQRSGATIAFDYFKQKILNGSSYGEIDGCTSQQRRLLNEFDHIRRMFEYIEDGDLWRWSLPNSKAFSSGLKDLNIEYDVLLNPSLFEQLLSLDLKSMISEGTKSILHKQKLIDETLRHSYQISLGGGAFGQCLAVNADSISELRSELGHQLATKSRDSMLRSIGAVVYRVPELEDDQLVKISLRSLDSEDTTPISQEFGGGGHRNAGSFMLISTEFERWKV